MLIEDLLVVIPARNEEARLAACLDSVAAASAATAVRVTTVVVLDRCDDRSAQIVAQRPWVFAVRSEAGRVGVARALGVRMATQRARVVHPERAWVANTDADTIVPVTWLARQIAFAEVGHDAILGTVRPIAAELTSRVMDQWLQRHHLVEGHPHIHGANLGVRLSSYLAAGGFPPLASDEDLGLVRALRDSGALVTATATTQVLTSGRTLGRTPPSFAGYLRVLEDAL